MSTTRTKDLIRKVCNALVDMDIRPVFIAGESDDACLDRLYRILTLVVEGREANILKWNEEIVVSEDRLTAAEELLAKLGW